MKDALPDREPCLVIEWSGTDGYHWVAEYYLRLPVGAFDIRNKENDDQGDTPDFIRREGHSRVPIGKTDVQSETPPLRGEGLDTPFRDGVHICTDARILRLPAYVVWGDYCEQIDTRKGRHQ